MHGLGEPGHRFDVLEDHRVIVRCFDGGDGVGDVEQLGVLGIFHALEGKLDVGGVKGIAVVKLDAFAQVEFPGHAIQPLPTFGQRG
jgi:hypothetical protein